MAISHALFACSLLSACSLRSPDLILYEAAGPDDVWSEGQRLHPARTDSLAFLTGFVDYSRRVSQDGPLFGTPMTFFVMARNTSPAPVILDPLRIRARYPDGRKFGTVDPESEIRSAAREMIAEQKRHAEEEAEAAVGDLSFALLDLVAMPFTAHDPAQQERDRAFRQERRERRQEEERDHEQAMRASGARRDQWARNALRKTTLLPGMSAQGSICLAQDTARVYPDTVILEYRFGDSDFAELGRYGRMEDRGSSSPDSQSTAASYRRPAPPSTPWTTGKP